MAEKKISLPHSNSTEKSFFSKKPLKFSLEWLQAILKIEKNIEFHFDKSLNYFRLYDGWLYYKNV